MIYNLNNLNACMFHQQLLPLVKPRRLNLLRLVEGSVQRQRNHLVHKQLHRRSAAEPLIQALALHRLRSEHQLNSNQLLVNQPLGRDLGLQVQPRILSGPLLQPDSVQLDLLHLCSEPQAQPLLHQHLVLLPETHLVLLRPIPLELQLKLHLVANLQQRTHSEVERLRRALQECLELALVWEPSEERQQRLLLDRQLPQHLVRPLQPLVRLLPPHSVRLEPAVLAILRFEQFR